MRYNAFTILAGNMSFFRTKTGVALVILITIAVIVFLQSSVFGGTFINLTLNVNSDLESGLIDHVTLDGDLSSYASVTSAGSMIWATTTDATSSTHNSDGIATDGTNIYVASHCDFCGPQGGTAFYTMKIDASTGAMLWATTTDPTSSTDNAYGVTSDGTNVYVTGNCSGCGSQGGNAIYTMKIDGSNGNMLWATTTDPSSSTDYPFAIASDGTNTYVTGFCTSCGSSGGTAVYTMKIDGSNGAMLWATTTDPSSSSDYGYGVTSDGTDVYVAGQCNGCGSQGGYALYTMKIDGSNGAMLWSTTTDPTSSNDYSRSITSDGTDVYVAGYCSGCGSQGGNAIYTVKVNGSTGAMLWSTTTDPTTSTDNAYAITWDGTNVYVAGQCTDCGSQGSTAVYTMKIDGSNGNMLWATTTDPTSSNDNGKGIAVIGSYAYVASTCNGCGSQGGTAVYTFKVAGSDISNSLTAVPGKISQAVLLNGSSDYINEGNIGSANSIAFWIKRTTIGAEKLIDIDGTDQIEINSSNQVVATSFPAATVYIDGSTASNVINDTDWHHIAVVDTTGVNASVFEVGRVSSSYFSGSIDDVRAYNRVLSAEEVNRVYGLGGTTHINKTLNVNPDLANGLIGHWSFDGDLTSSVADSSGTGNTGYLSTNGEATSTKTVPGEIGQALSFDGTDDYVDVGDINILESLPLSVSGWINMNQLPSTAGDAFRVITKYRAFPNGSTWRFMVASIDRLAMDEYGPDCTGQDHYLDVGGGNVFTASDLHRWIHVAMTWAADGTVTFYINGVNKGGGTAGTSLCASDAHVWIGAHNNSGSPTSVMDGLIDDVRAYSRVLSPSEVKRLYEVGATTHMNTTINTNPDLNSGLVGHWTFDGKDMINNVSDTSGQGNDGGLSTSGESTTSKQAIGVLGQALSFDGTDDYVDVSDSFYSDSLSACAWVYPDNLASVRNIVEKRNSSGVSQGLNEWELVVENNKATFNIWTTGGALALNAIGNTTLSTSTWYYLCGVGTGNGNTGYVYVNGVADGNAAQSAATADTSSRIQVGPRSSDNDTRYWSGKIDDVRIYNRALSAAEVKRLYELGK